MDEVEQREALLGLIEALEKEIQELKEETLPTLARLLPTKETALLTRLKRLVDKFHEIEDARRAEKDAGVCDEPTATQIASALFYLRGNMKERSVGDMRSNAEEGAQVLERLLRHEGYNPGKTSEEALDLHGRLLVGQSVPRSFCGGFTAEERERGYHRGRCEKCRKRFRKEW